MLLLIDNYDSFTYNLVHYFGELGAPVKVYRNDAISVSEVLSIRPSAVIISPGPCDPDQAGICLELIKACAGNVPILGVCLGHQAIGQAFGGKVIRAPDLMHGKICDVYHVESCLYKDIPSPFAATRYHSLIVEKESLPKCFNVTANTKEGIVMGLEHKEHVIHGIQFHPESIASEHGHDLLRNFLTIVQNDGEY